MTVVSPQFCDETFLSHLRQKRLGPTKRKRKHSPVNTKNFLTFSHVRAGPDCYEAAGKKLDTFSLRIRQSLPSSYVLSIKYFVMLVPGGTTGTDWKMLSSVDVLIWANVAPKACQLLRRYVENKYCFVVGHVVGRSAADEFFTWNQFKPVSGSTTSRYKTLTEEEMDVEVESRLLAVPGSVLLSMSKYGPHLTTMDTVGQPLLGQQPQNKLAEGVTSRWPGIPVGKIIGFSPNNVKTSQDLFNACKWGRQVGKSAAVDCSIVESDS